MKNPTDYRYTESHEWVRKDDAKTCRVGITAFAVKELRDLVFIELPEDGRQLQRGEVFGEVESVKAVSDLFAPVSGKVVRANRDVEQDLGRLVKSPFEDGWLVALEMDEPSQWNDLLDSVAYEKLIEEAAH